MVSTCERGRVTAALLVGEISDLIGNETSVELAADPGGQRCFQIQIGELTLDTQLTC